MNDQTVANLEALNEDKGTTQVWDKKAILFCLSHNLYLSWVLWRW